MDIDTLTTNRTQLLATIHNLHQAERRITATAIHDADGVDVRYEVTVRRLNELADADLLTREESPSRSKPYTIPDDARPLYAAAADYVAAAGDTLDDPAAADRRALLKK